MTMKSGTAVAALFLIGVWSAQPVWGAPVPATQPRIQVGDQPVLPGDGCVYAGLGYSDRIFIDMGAGIYQCRAQHWFAAPDAVAAEGMSPANFFSATTQAELAGDGCIYAGMGYSDGAAIQTSVGSYSCKAHQWDKR